MMEHIDFSNFRQVTGIEISNGEPGVIKALQKLWQKLQLLEKASVSTKDDAAWGQKEASFPELQQKLLEVQLQYVRKILRENNGTCVPCDKRDTSKGVSADEASSRDCSDHIPVRDCCEKHTQTDSISAKHSLCSSDEISPLGFVKNPGEAQRLKCKNDLMLPADFNQLKATSGARMKPAANVGSKQWGSWTHYHLKLSDVPFIIGTSTSSHSVVANVQKIISLMKVHNKGLCSSLPDRPRRARSLDLKKHNAELGYRRTYSSPDLSQHQDLQNRLFSLSDELKALTLKLGSQKNPGRPSGTLSEHSYMDYANILNLIEMKTRQIIALQKALRKNTGQQFCYQRSKSFCQSSPCSHYPEESSPVSDDTNVVNRLSKTEMKQVICSFSDSSSKAGCFERRKMVRELKEFQLHLQQEDIHWK